MSKNKKIILSALLLALFIIFDRLLTIHTKILEINLSLLTVMIAGMILGWKYSTIIAALGDIIGSILWPFGPYFFGLTISTALAGLIYGLFLYEKPNEEKKHFIWKAIISNVIVYIMINLLLNSLWFNILYGKTFIYYFNVRKITQIGMMIVNSILIIFIEKALKNPIKKYLYKEEQ